MSEWVLVIILLSATDAGILHMAHKFETLEQCDYFRVHFLPTAMPPQLAQIPQGMTVKPLCVELITPTI